MARLKVLVIGSGGREHALVKAFSECDSVVEVFVAPGNPGMAEQAVIKNIPTHSFLEIKNFCLDERIDFVMIGPENPLVEGLSDFLRAENILVVGPSQKAAQLEGSKIFSKKFMIEHQIPTSRFEIVSTVEETLSRAGQFQSPYVLKADGLAAGKGVYICKNLSELKKAAEGLFDLKILGDAGKRALLEEFIPGYELSYLFLTNGTSFQALPICQDHKRLQDGDQGPNTGGMGTIAPMEISKDLDQKIQSEIIEKTLSGFKKENLFYRGVVFLGLMVKDQKPYLLEYNCRFGDPETQVLVPLIKNDLAELLFALAQGEISPVQFKNIFATCVILAAPGYPDHPEKGAAITGDPLANTPNSYFIHAGTSRDPNWKVFGGRVLGAVGLGPDRQTSIATAYAQAEKVSWVGLQKRMDIGART